MSPIPAIKGGIQAYANAVNRLNRLNIKLTTKIIKEQMKLQGVNISDNYTKTGKLTQQSIDALAKNIAELNLPKNATWDMILKKTIFRGIID